MKKYISLVTLIGLSSSLVVPNVSAQTNLINTPEKFQIVANAGMNGSNTANSSKAFVAGDNIYMTFETIDKINVNIAQRGDGSNGNHNLYGQDFGDNLSKTNFVNSIVYEHINPTGTCMTKSGLPQPKVGSNPNYQASDLEFYYFENGAWHAYTSPVTGEDCTIEKFRLKNPHPETKYNYTIKTTEAYSPRNFVASMHAYTTQGGHEDERSNEATKKSNELTRYDSIAGNHYCYDSLVKITVPDNVPPPPPTVTPPPPPTVPSVPAVPSTGGGTGGGGYTPPSPSTDTPPAVVPSIPSVPTVPAPSVPTEPAKPGVPPTEFTKIPNILPQTGTNYGTAEYFKKYIRTSKSVETKFQKHLFRLAGNENTDLAHWLQVLPKQDRGADKYLVVPSTGLVIPVNSVAETDKAYSNFLNGKAEHFHKYLESGSVELPGSKFNGYGEAGNKVIGGHSSFWKKSKSRYKTHFQSIIGLEKGTEIWVYQKNESGKFDRFVYKTTDSYNTKATDTSILEQTAHSQLTLFTCTPIGGVQGRWIVKSEFVGKF